MKCQSLFLKKEERKILSVCCQFNWQFVCVEVFSPFNPTESCRARSVYLATCLLGRLSPLSG